MINNPSDFLYQFDKVKEEHNNLNIELCDSLKQHISDFWEHLFDCIENIDFRIEINSLDYFRIEFEGFKQNISFTIKYENKFFIASINNGLKHNDISEKESISNTISLNQLVYNNIADFIGYLRQLEVLKRSDIMTYVRQKNQIDSFVKIIWSNNEHILQTKKHIKSIDVKTREVNEFIVKRRYLSKGYVLCENGTTLRPTTKLIYY